MAGISLSGLMFSSIPAPSKDPLIYNHPRDSKPESRGGHDARHAPHQLADRRRQRRAAGGCGTRTVSDLFGSHGFKYGTAAGIARREPAEVLIEVALHLTLGLDDEAETGAVTHEGGQCADGEGAGVPERVEQARPRAELPEARLAPGEMIGFRARRGQQHAARGVRAGREGLAVIQRLRGEL